MRVVLPIIKAINIEPKRVREMNLRDTCTWNAFIVSLVSSRQSPPPADECLLLEGESSDIDEDAGDGGASCWLFMVLHDGVAKM